MNSLNLLHKTLSGRRGTLQRVCGLALLSLCLLGSSTAQTISGTVFEDAHYGGGAGRNQTTAAGVGRPGVRVELYDDTGVGVLNTTTNSSGAYSFTTLGLNQTWYVRVVNSTVTSARSGGGGAELGVQTFWVDGSTATPTERTDYVGGLVPSVSDAGTPPVLTLAIFNPATFVYTAPLSLAGQQIQSISPVNTSNGSVSGIDFGFNFDTIVNVNNSGQGSLRQVMTNANQLANTGLAQAGLPAGEETTIFMISDGNAHPGLRAGLANLFTSGQPRITLAGSLLPVVTNALNLDGRTQIDGNGLRIFVDAQNVTTTPLIGGIVAALNASVKVYNFVLANSQVTTVTGGGQGSNSSGVALSDGTSGSRVDNCIITNTRNSGIETGHTGAVTTNFVFVNNYIDTQSSASVSPNADGITLTNLANSLVSGNTIRRAPGYGIDLTSGANSGVVNVSITNNIIELNGSGNTAATGQNGGIGIRMGQQITIANNIIRNSGGDGIILRSQTGFLGDQIYLSNNQIYDNAQQAIDITNASNNNGDGVTANDGLAPNASTNRALDYPIFTYAVLTGTDLEVRGFVGNAVAGPNATFGNLLVEVYEADNTPANQDGALVLGDGRSLPHGELARLLGSCPTNNNGAFGCVISNVTGLSDPRNLSGLTQDVANQRTSEPGAVASPGPALYKSVVWTDRDGTNTITAGDDLTWTVQVANNDWFTMTGVQLQDSIPANTTLQGPPVVTLVGGNTLAASNTNFGAGDTNLLNSGAEVPFQGVIRVDFTTRINGGFGPGQLTNQASLDAGNGYAALLSDAVDNTTTGLPAGVTVPANSLAQTQTASLDPTLVTVAAPTLAHLRNQAVYYLNESLLDKLLVNDSGAASPGAAHAPERGNLVTWASSFEADNLGFIIYRQERDGALVRLNKELVAGSAWAVQGTPLTAGAAYHWWDAAGTPESVYVIADIALSGVATQHPSVGAQGCAEACTRVVTTLAARGTLTEHSVTLSELNARASSATTANQFEYPAGQRANVWGNSQPVRWSADAHAQQLRLAQQRAVKISVTQAGWYRLTGAQLHALGFEGVTTGESRQLQLYADGQAVQFQVRPEGGRREGPLGLTGTVEFYGVPQDTRETGTRIYWLVLGDTPGLHTPGPVKVVVDHATNGENGVVGLVAEAAHQTVSGTPNSAENPSLPAPNFAVTVEKSDQTLFFGALSNGEDEANFFGAVISNTLTNQTLTVREWDTTTPAATVRVALQGATQVPHRVRVTLNGTRLGEMTLAAQEQKADTFAVPAGLLREGENVISYQALNNSDISVVVSTSLTYPRRYVASNNQLRFTTRAAVSLTGFTAAQVRVFDVTAPTRPFEVATVRHSVAGPDVVSVALPRTKSARTLYAVGTEQLSVPAGTELNGTSQWTQPTQGADFVIVAPAAWHAALAPFVARRAGEGLRVSVIDPADIYAEWSGGSKEVNALRRFLAWARENWETAPRYVLLVGDASYDPRNYLGVGGAQAQDYVPTGYVGTPYLETASDETLVDFDGDNVGEMSIGRWPVRTESQVQLLVAKTLAYTPDNSRGAVLVADRPEGYDFAGVNQRAQSLLPVGMLVTRINRAGLSDAQAREQIRTALNAGPALVQYAGHGSTTVWTNAGLLDNAGASALTNGTRLPVVLSYACLNAYFQDIYSDSLAESLLLAPQGGAAAVWASTGLTAAESQAPLAQAVLRGLYGPETSVPRLGDALRQARAQSLDRTVRQTWVLLGDPTLPVR